MALLLYGAAVLIGILLGLLGGGGSILTMPMLVYLAGLPAKSAIITSLIVVGVTSALTVISYARRRMVCWKTGLTFSSSGMVGAFMGGRLTEYLPDPVLLVLFAVVMLLASVPMLRSKTAVSEQAPDNKNFCPLKLPVSAILFDGFLVGLVTGLIGVGGGFLLVPALTLLAGLPIQAAIGTSLFIIVLQSVAALAGHARHMAVNPELTFIITACTIIGSVIGANLARFVNSGFLKRGFGLFVFGLGCVLLYQEFSEKLIIDLKRLVVENLEFVKGALTIVLGLMGYRLWTWLHWNRQH